MKDEVTSASSPSDVTLVRYLLGGLPEEDAQRLDELSVVDAEFAERLRALEHDLADAYVRDELSTSDREQWEQRYLPSEHGQADLRLARALLARERRRAPVRHAARFSWGLASAAALLMAVVVGYFVVVHRSAAPPVLTSIAPTTPQPPVRGATAPKVIALTLTPMTRSLAPAPVLRVPSGTDQVRLTLRLEPDDFKRYDVDVKDLSTNATVWGTANAAPVSAGSTKSLPITIPAHTLESHHYLITVTTAPPRGSEILDTYPLAIVLE